MTEQKMLILYGTSWCGATRRARQTLDAHGIQYTYVDIDSDMEGRAFVETTNHGFRSVPTLLFPNGSTLTEPTTIELEDAIAKLLR